MSGVPSVKDLFADALERPEAERDAFLREACGDDTARLEEVRQLLAAHERARRLFDDGAETTTSDAEAPGSVIGHYRLLQQIGEGGFGAVYMAEQREPVVRRVAVKILKLGMDTRSVVARFEAERQALALMDHPNIARVYDAGATAAGRPYFAMELVRGLPITAYCDQANLSIPERLELFTQVCRAVQHAHTKGVIHRDLKPSNVLVSEQDGRPHCKVIDFGIAKATQRPLTDKTLFTEFRQLIGTPEYMSPEQASGSLDIDTRSDVYSLGVLLYELLAGVTPLDPHRLRSAEFGEMQRMIREVEAPRPSTRISSLGDTLTGIAAARRTEPRQLGKLLKGELDWIVLRALEKDRGRRYDSAGNFAADVERYLSGRPVEAAPPSRAYRLAKFVRRNRGAVIAATLIAAALVLGVIGTSIGLVNARRAEHLAMQRLQEAERAKEEADRASRISVAVTDFFTLDVLDLEPTAPGAPELTVREVLERVPAKIERHFATEPEIEGVIRERVGQLYFNMGELRRALEYLEPAARLLEQGLGPDHRTTLIAHQRLAEVMLALDRYAEAEALFDRVYQTRRRMLEPGHNFTFNSLMQRGYARVLGGRVDEGLRDAETALRDVAHLRGEGSRTELMFRRSVIDMYLRAGRAAEAEALARDGLARILADPALAGGEADYRAYLGEALLSQDRPAEAMPELDAAWAKVEGSYPPSHRRVVDLRVTRGQAMAELGRLDEAAEQLAAAYTWLERISGPESRRSRFTAGLLADLAAQRGDAEAARAWESRR